MAKSKATTPSELPTGWKESGGHLVAGYRFKDFVQATTFLHEVAFAAEAQEHHPDFSVHWNEVRFTVWSHDVDAITERDQKLAAKIARIAERHGATILGKP